ncbi:isoamylase N-terminal domain protein, partial [Glaesserella parasuis D74]
MKEKVKNTTSLKQDNQFIEQLANGCCQDPFAYLGVHQVDDGVIVRAYLPEAEQVTVINDNSEPIVQMEQIDDRGFFAANLVGEKTDLSYRLLVRYAHTEIDIEDPYRFQSHFSDLDNWLLSEGTHVRPYEKLGAHLVTQNEVGGIHFSL